MSPIVFRIAVFALAVAFSASALPAQQEAAGHRIVVEKGKRQLSVYLQGELIRTWRVALGPNPTGHKQQQGDGRTPEGQYTIDFRNAESDYYRSLHISYPSAADVEEARRAGVSPGGEIMIHGLPNGIAAVAENEDWTRGCIALSNEAIDELWKLVADGTAVELRP